MSSVNVNLCQESINDEIDSFESNRTWHLVDLLVVKSYAVNVS